MNIFDSAIIVSAIAGGVMGGIVATIISLGVLRSQRRGNDAAAAPTHTTEWRAPSGPLSRHQRQVERPTTTEPPDTPEP